LQLQLVTAAGISRKLESATQAFPIGVGIGLALFGLQSFTDWAKDNKEDKMKVSKTRLQDELDRLPRFPCKALAICLGLILCPLVSSADSGVEWGKRALKIQNQIDFATRFYNSFWVGTHNSYNARMWGYTTDPNQKRKPQDQLESGAVELTYDIYWSADQMKLCHGSCGAPDKTFREGLDEIRDFLDEHPEAVVMLKLEVTGSTIDGKWSKLTDQLDGAIGKRIYKPSHAGLSTGCQTLDPASITKRTILAKGKNLIVVVTPEPKHGCTSDGGWNNLVFTGFKIQDTSTGTPSTAYKFTTPKDSTQCLANKQDSKQDMQRVHDGHTWNGVGDGNDTNVLTPSSYQGYMRGGLNVFELFNFNGENADTKYPFLKPQDLVWSWREGEPNNMNDEEDCAVAEINGHFNDVVCTGTYRFTCYDQTTGIWKFTVAKGSFSLGDARCKAEFGSSYSFAVPVNPYEQDKMKLAMPNASPAIGSTESVWVNYQDLRMEGQWVANSSNYTPYTYTKIATVGGDGGSSFDDFGQMKVDVHRGSPRRVIKVTMRGGARLDMVGLAYSSSGTVIEHGGSGGTYKEMAIADNEYISHYATCSAYYNGSKRVFYLALWKNTGQSISAGTWVDKDHCTGQIPVPAGQTLFGFHGRSGENVDALGFYFRVPGT